MKSSTILGGTLALTTVLFSYASLAGDYIRLGLPDGALRRLGKGESRLVAWSHDGMRLAVGGTIGIWVYDAETGDEVSLLAGHRSEVVSMVFSRDGTILASASSDYTVRLWDVATWQEKSTLTGHTHRVNSVAFSPDGTTLASGSTDNTVRLWDVTTGQEENTLTGHTGTVNSVAFSPDGTTLASASRDETVRLWDAATGHEKNTSQVIRQISRRWCFRRMGRHWRAPVLIVQCDYGTWPRERKKAPCQIKTGGSGRWRFRRMGRPWPAAVTTIRYDCGTCQPGT